MGTAAALYCMLCTAGTATSTGAATLYCMLLELWPGRHIHNQLLAAQCQLINRLIGISFQFGQGFT